MLTNIEKDERERELKLLLQNLFF